jgi:NAD(P)H-hydrate epimerase
MSADARGLTREQVREVDRRAIEDYGLPGLVLMENAGRGAAELLLSRGKLGPVVICCGKGNNGGDGLVMARHLDLAGCDVHVLLACDPTEFSGDARINYEIVRRSGIRLTEASRNPPAVAEALHAADWIVDALLGTGAAGEVRGPYASVIEQINGAERRVLAVDLPSGLDCDTGRPLGPCVRATLTATFVARKVGFDLPEAAVYLGEVHVIGIGAPAKLPAECCEGSADFRGG